MLTETALAEALSTRGYKLTRPRLAVLKVVARATASLRPAEIHTRAQAFYSQTGLVTV